MWRSLSKKVLRGYTAAFILLLFSYVLVIVSTLRLQKQNQSVNRSRETINQLEIMLSYIKDAEIGLRGLVMMKDEKFLLPYYTSGRKVDSVYKALKELTLDNQLQSERVNQLGGLIKEKFELTHAQIEALRNNQFEVTDSIRVSGFVSKKLMDSIRFIAGTMEIRERAILAQRTKTVNSSSSSVYPLIISSLLISLFLAGYSIVYYAKENKARELASNKAVNYYDQLEKKISELSDANKELIELRSIEKFASTGRLARMIAHEIRNPLTNINLSAEQLNFGDLSDEEKDIYVNMILRNSNRINTMITELLQATKVTELKFERYPINDLLDETIAAATDSAALRNIQIVKKYVNPSPSVRADRDKLKIAFMNIIVNAIESVPEETGVIEVFTRRENRTCIISIKDNGSGMDQETALKIFDPYFSTKSQGNGLGLTNTQNIILSHKGKINVVSEPGKGTTFIISISEDGVAI